MPVYKMSNSKSWTVGKFEFSLWQFVPVTAIKKCIYISSSILCWIHCQSCLFYAQTSRIKSIRTK